MITEYVPGTYVTHDMLHMRGGHQTTWLVDGVSIPNTNIGSNVGPQIDPKDIDYLEALRGSYEAEYGDRTFGIFNIVPRSGFERDGRRTGDHRGTTGKPTTRSLCGHTNRFAYYVSANGNQSDLGLQPPIPQIYHDATMATASSPPSSTIAIQEINSGWQANGAGIITRYLTIPIPTALEIRFTTPRPCAMHSTKRTGSSISRGFERLTLI